MDTNCLMFSWKRTVPGREQVSVAHFREYVEYLSGLQQNKQIESFEPILLTPNGQGIVGFFLIRGAPGKLTELMGTDDWKKHVMRGMMHLEDPCISTGVCGAKVGERLAMWSSLIPQ